MKDGRFCRGYDAIAARAGREGPQVVLRVEPDRAVWGDDERPPMWSRDPILTGAPIMRVIEYEDATSTRGARRTSPCEKAKSLARASS
jgi:hypothetical protein